MLVKTHMPTYSNGIPGESELMCGDDGEWQGWWLSVVVMLKQQSAVLRQRQEETMSLLRFVLFFALSLPV